MRYKRLPLIRRFDDDRPCGSGRPPRRPANDAARSAAKLSNGAAGIGVSSFRVIPMGRSPVWVA